MDECIEISQQMDVLHMEEENGTGCCAPNLTPEERQMIKEQEAGKRQVMIPILQDDYQEEEEEENEPAMIKDVEYMNGVPYYQDNHLLMDEKNHFKCVIFERIGYDDSVGATYLAMAQDKELILRVEREDASTVAMEHEFLKKVEAANNWLYFSQVHSQWTCDGYNFLLIYYRPGPSFQQIRQFLNFKAFTYGTGARLAKNMLKSIRIAHEAGKLVGALDYEMFHFDAAGRNLFMSDISTLQDKDSEDASWKGPNLYAPVNQGRLTMKDELESWFFMLCEMICGVLPWSKSEENDINEVKRASVIDGSLLAAMPQQFKDLHHLIGALPSDTIQPEMYDRMENYCVEIYTQIGAVKDLDDNLDFERDPNEAELPRFVLEKRPIEEGENTPAESIQSPE